MKRETLKKEYYVSGFTGRIWQRRKQHLYVKSVETYLQSGWVSVQTVEAGTVL